MWVTEACWEVTWLGMLHGPINTKSKNFFSFFTWWATYLKWVVVVVGHIMQLLNTEVTVLNDSMAVDSLTTGSNKQAKFSNHSCWGEGSALMQPSDVQATLWPLFIGKKKMFFFFCGLGWCGDVMKWCSPLVPATSPYSGNINKSQADVTQSNKKRIFSFSHLLLLRPSDIYINTLFIVLNPALRWVDIKCDSTYVWVWVCVLMCMQMVKEGGYEGCKASYFVCGVHISDSAERPPSMRRVFIHRSRNNLKPAPMLTLVHTRFHVAPTRDYICEALHKNDLLDIIKQLRCNGARLCTCVKIVFCWQLLQPWQQLNVYLVKWCAPIEHINI